MSSPVDPKAFAKLKRIAPNQLAARRDPTEWRARPVPEEIAFKLTNRCDLRCTHCYQWSEIGYHHSLLREDKGRDLPLATIEKVLEATRELRSNVFLWGGEPLVYREWDGLVDLLVQYERWTSVCTNGTMIDRRLGSLLRMSRQLELSISIDGFEQEHEALRGERAFTRSIAGLRSLVAAKRAGTYHGEISANCVIGDAMVPRMYDFVAFLELEGVETLYISFPWYLAEAGAQLMDGYVAEHFPEMRPGAHASWHSFTFHLDPNRLDELRDQLARIDAAPWRLNVRYNPALSADELEEFIRGSAHPAQNKTRCLALRTRMDVFPNGDVVSCKFYPEFVVGNLNEATVAQVWHGATYDRVRETVARCGLMPACAKCNLLYTRGT